MQVTIKMRLEEALTFQTGQPKTPALEQILTIIREKGGELKPIYPGAGHPLLAPYFSVEVPDLTIAKELIGQLLDCPAIEAAYLTPRPELPVG
jgi:hypothetical protein